MVSDGFNLTWAVCVACSGERLSIPAPVMAEIIESAQGDVRNAVHTLQFQSISSEPVMEPEPEKKSKTKRRKKSGGEDGDSEMTASSDTADTKSQAADGSAFDEEDDLTAPSAVTQRRRVVVSGRDEMFSIFHALGKILHTKEGRAAEAIVERSGLPPALFTEWLHENYFDHVPTNAFECVEGASEYFSDADLFTRASTQRFGDVRTSPDCSFAPS